ncbi:hypothetical protein L1887_24150 [Cichorium endivia]|nr:hypothetical protein L1887_24150 [Cichorium endivia]
MKSSNSTMHDQTITAPIQENTLISEISSTIEQQSTPISSVFEELPCIPANFEWNASEKEEHPPTLYKNFQKSSAILSDFDDLWWIDQPIVEEVLSLKSVSSPLELLLFLEVQASEVVKMDSGGHVTRQLSDARSRFLGLKSPKLFSILVKGRWGMLCFSSRPWLGYVHRDHFLLTPLWYETLQYVASFSSDQCAEGVVAVAGDALRSPKEQEKEIVQV